MSFDLLEFVNIVNRVQSANFLETGPGEVELDIEFVVRRVCQGQSLQLKVDRLASAEADSWSFCPELKL